MVFDYSNGGSIMPMGNDMGMDMNGRLHTRVGNNCSMDMESGALHITSGWNGQGNSGSFPSFPPPQESGTSNE